MLEWEQKLPICHSFAASVHCVHVSRCQMFFFSSQPQSHRDRLREQNVWSYVYCVLRPFLLSSFVQKFVHSCRSCKREKKFGLVELGYWLFFPYSRRSAGWLASTPPDTDIDKGLERTKKQHDDESREIIYQSIFLSFFHSSTCCLLVVLKDCSRRPWNHLGLAWLGRQDEMRAVKHMINSPLSTLLLTLMCRSWNERNHW